MKPAGLLHATDRRVCFHDQNNLLLNLCHIKEKQRPPQRWPLALKLTVCSHRLDCFTVLHIYNLCFQLVVTSKSIFFSSFQNRKQNDDYSRARKITEKIPITAIIADNINPGSKKLLSFPFIPAKTFISLK